MAPTTDYRIVLEPTPNLLTQKVKAALAEGWQVYGGVTVINNSWAQALVKTEDLMEQMNAKLAAIVANTATIKTAVMSIDDKTPEIQ